MSVNIYYIYISVLRLKINNSFPCRLFLSLIHMFSIGGNRFVHDHASFAEKRTQGLSLTCEFAVNTKGSEIRGSEIVRGSKLAEARSNSKDNN